MKVAIFENEQIQVEGAFSFLNKRYYNGRIRINYYSSSQHAKPYDFLVNFDLIFVDIELALNSELDGFNLLLKLNQLGIPQNKIIVLTGFSKVDERLKELNLPKYEILQKPFNFPRLKSILDKIPSPS